MDRYSTTEWLRIATAGIVSPKEREQAKQELADHIFDHTEALLSTGLSRSQAQQQAVAAMGDPKAVGKHLRRVHQPILTKLLTICRRAAIVLAMVTVWVVFISSGRLEMFWQRQRMTVIDIELMQMQTSVFQSQFRSMTQLMQMQTRKSKHLRFKTNSKPLLVRLQITHS